MNCFFGAIGCLVVRTSYFAFDVFAFFPHSQPHAWKKYRSGTQFFLLYFYSYFFQISVQSVIKSKEHFKTFTQGPNCTGYLPTLRLGQMISDVDCSGFLFVCLYFNVTLYRIHSLHVDFTLFPTRFFSERPVTFQCHKVLLILDNNRLRIETRLSLYLKCHSIDLQLYRE